MKYISGNLDIPSQETIKNALAEGTGDAIEKKLPHIMTGDDENTDYLGECIFKLHYDISDSGTYTLFLNNILPEKVFLNGEEIDPNTNTANLLEGEYTVEIYSKRYWEEIDEVLFNNLPGLKKIEFPRTLKRFGLGSIQNCSDLEILVLEKNVEELIYPNSGEYFSNCESLGKIQISKRNKNFRSEKGKYIFSKDGEFLLSLDGSFPKTRKVRTLYKGWTKKTTFNDLVIPDSVETLEESVFEGCTFTGSLTLGEGLKKIKEKAFYNVNITELDFLIIKPQNPPIIESPQYFELRDIDENGDLIPGSEFYTNFEKNILPYRNSSVWNTLFQKLQTHNRNWYESQYLTLEALETGTFSFNLAGYNYGSYINVTSVSYSIDGGNNWVTLDNIDTSVSNVITTPAIRGGDKVIWKGTAIKYGNNGGSGIYSYFSSTGSFSVSGNIMSLIYGDNFENQTEFLGDANATMGSLTQKACIFNGLFQNSNVIEANNLILPAPILVADCYNGMFRDCTSLIAPPVLPATTLANSCYSHMFNGCTSLTVVPELSALTMANNCYGYMFQNCKSLVQAPSLPATTLAERCYQYMFIGCRSLVESPVLPAETLISQCYVCMFSDCYNLRRIKAMFTTTPTTGYGSPTYNWVANIPSGGTFIKNSAATWNLTGICGIPSGWTVETASS